MNTKLQAQIEATNLSHKRANELYKELVEIFTPLVGQKIVKADLSFTSKVEKLIPKLEYNNSIAIWKNSSRYTISFSVRSCVKIPNDGGVVYDETVVYIGNLNGDTLTGIVDRQERKTDYKIEEIEQKRKEYQAVKEQLERIQSELFPFSVD